MFICYYISNENNRNHPLLENVFRCLFCSGTNNALYIFITCRNGNYLLILNRLLGMLEYIQNVENQA